MILPVSTAFAQYMGNVGSEGQTGSYTLEEALEIQTRRIVSQSTYDINIPTGASDPEAPYFWQSEKDGSRTGDVTIDRGDTILWKNGDTTFHTITSITPDGELDDLFDSGFFGPGKSYSRQFDDTGVFHYFCSIHPWMTGIVTVESNTSTDSSAEWIDVEDIPLINEEPDSDVEISRLKEQVRDLKIENRELKQEINDLKETLYEQLKTILNILQELKLNN